MNEQQYLARLYDDFFFFVGEIWRDRELDTKAPLDWIEQDLCEWVAYGPRRSGVLAPRGYGKTHLVTAALTCWDLYRDPDWKSLIVSKSEGHAKLTLALIREWIDHVPFLQHLRPGAHQFDSATQFEVGPAKPDRTPSVTAKGIGGQITGTRAHRVIADDVETPENTKTIDARDELSNTVKEFSKIASYGEKRITYVGTFHHEESLYIKLIERGYAFRTWPLVTPHPEDKLVGLSPTIQKRIDAGLLKPSSARGVFDGSIIPSHRYDRQHVIEQMAEGMLDFAMQHMLIADLGDSLRYPLRLQDLIIFPVHRDQAPISIAWGKNKGQGESTRIEDIPAQGLGTDALYGPIFYDQSWAPYTSTVAFLDPSGGGAGSDEMAWAITSQLHGHIWLKALEAVQPGGASPENLRRIARSMRTHRVRRLAIEKNFGGEFLAPLLEVELRKLMIPAGGRDDEGNEYPDGWACAVELVHNSTQKEVRIIDILDPVLSSHRLVVSPDVIRPIPDKPAKYQLQHQLTRLTRQRNALENDDKIDALAGSVAMHQLELSIDTEQAADQQREKWLEEQLEAFYAQAGHRVQAPRWFQHQ